jgi:ribulose-5-phosphate 4-epimerase/fuculose-1-phosphate aldolase
MTTLSTTVCSRRRVLQTALLAAAAGSAALRPLFAQAPATATAGGGAANAGANLQPLPSLPEFRRVVAANRILAQEGVVDAFGHVSVRDPRNRERFVMSRSRSPALVELGDLMEFDLDGTPVDARGRTAYGERMIHAAVYAARADVQAVVHHHASGVLPFTITAVPLRPVIHTASVIGAQIPVWDIRDRFGATDMLVRTIEQGRDLARVLAGNTCLLMRGHGAVVTGASVQQAVLTAIYLQVNANVLREARSFGAPRELTDEEIAKSTEAQFSPLALDRAWEYYCVRAGVDPV